MKPALSILIILTAISVGYGQSIESWSKMQDTTVVYEKVYLHIDREYYAPGDTLWFKSYLVSGINNKLESGYKNIYVQLVSPEGEVIANRLLMSVYGTSHGDIALSDSLPAGQYIVRATTRYLENFGEKSDFHQRIWIAKSGYFEKEDSIPAPEPELGEILFFPEGGNLVANTANYVAFKAIGKDGKGMAATGRILDHSGKTITTFKATFLGMGQFLFMPKENETYSVKIDGHPGYHCQLPEMQENGLALHCEDETKDILMTLSRNYKTDGQKTFYVVARYKGVSLFYKTIELNGFEQGIRLSKSLFPLGISKISVLNNTMDVVAERLVFLSDGQLTNVKISTDKKDYSTREKVQLDVEPMLATNDSVTSTLSVAVVNEGYFSSEGNSQTIQSYLLLDSDLKGSIETPARYFVDEDSITSAQKLDLLMKVQGWRSYYWDDILKEAPGDLKNWTDAGITVSGKMKRLFRGTMVKDGTIQLSSFSPLLTEKSETDSLGLFRFERLYLKDSTEVLLLGKNEKGHKGVEIIPDVQRQGDTLVLPNVINLALAGIGLPMKYAKEKYLKQLAWQEFNPEKGNILLEDVNVAAKKIEHIQQVELFKPYMYLADNSYLITPADYKYGDVYDFLLKKAGLPAGEWITLPDGFYISVLQYCLDGEYKKAWGDYDESGEVLNIPIKEVYQIDVDKNVRVIRAEVYVYKKKFGLSVSSGSSVRGKAIFRVHGFQQPHKFYSPKYTPANINNGMPDYRATLFWSPEVRVSGGKANLEFYTCDGMANYVVIVEGISKNGKICIGTKQITVNKQRGH